MICKSFGPKIVVVLATFAAGACTNAPSDTPPPPPGLPGSPALSDMPPGHPPMPGSSTQGATMDGAAPHPARSATPARVEVPAEVKATWKTVTLSVAVDGKTHNVQSAIGTESALPQGSMAVRVLAYLPAFQIGDGVITSNGNNPTNPAALVRLTEKGKTLAEGWVFQTLPDFDSFKSERAKVRLISADKK